MRINTYIFAGLALVFGFIVIGGFFAVGSAGDDSRFSRFGTRTVTNPGGILASDDSDDDSNDQAGCNCVASQGGLASALHRMRCSTCFFVLSASSSSILPR